MSAAAFSSGEVPYYFTVIALDVITFFGFTFEKHDTDDGAGIPLKMIGYEPFTLVAEAV